MPQKSLLTTVVGSYPQPEWLIDRAKLAGRFPPRVRAKELWRVEPALLGQAQDDATQLAIRAQERAGLDLLNVDPLGLDEIDLRVLRTIIEKYGGGPVGVETLAECRRVFQVAEDEGDGLANFVRRQRRGRRSSQRRAAVAAEAELGRILFAAGRALDHAHRPMAGPVTARPARVWLVLLGFTANRAIPRTESPRPPAYG